MDEVLQARSHPVDLLAEIEAVEETRDERAAIAIQRRAGSAGALAGGLRAQLLLADHRDPGGGGAPPAPRGPRGGAAGGGHPGAPPPPPPRPRPLPGRRDT